MQQWLTTYGPNLVWPAMLIVGAIAMVLVWSIASAVYEQLSGIAAGAAFMIIGLGLLLYCGFYLVSHSPIRNLPLFLNGVGILAGISAIGAGAFGLRNANDF
ncbi:MAG: hypothetical protein ACR2IE_03610 [Candidatus Sumerlaeaceae bacterium]